METRTVTGAAHPDSGTPATSHARSRGGTAAPKRGRGTFTGPEHLTRITEAAAVAAVEAFYRPGAGSRVVGSASQASHVVR